MRAKRVTVLIASLVASIGLVAGSIVQLPSTSTFTPTAVHAADDFPSWNDILKARGDEKAKKSEIDRVKGLISKLQGNLATAQAERARVQSEYDAINVRLGKAQDKYNDLQLQAAEQKQKAEEAKKKAGALVAQMARSGTNNVSVDLYLSGDKAGDLLYGLSSMSRVTEVSNGIYEEAERSSALAKSLAAQAKVVQNEIEKLLDAAQTKLQEKQAAEDNYADALSNQQDNQENLNQQLTALQSTTEQLTQERADGLEKQRLERIRLAKIAAQKRAKARALAKKRAAEARKRAAAAVARGGDGDGDDDGGEHHATPPSSGGPSGGGSSSGGSSSGGSHEHASSYGVVYPTINYRITSPYGYRIHPIYGYKIYHRGVDFAAASGTPVYAAAKGKVIRLAYDGFRGYYIDIRHRVGGVTVTSRYQHLKAGSRIVHVGQRVKAGQRIARVGSTGDSTGPHLHFEIHIASNALNQNTTINPMTWLRKYS